MRKYKARILTLISEILTMSTSILALTPYIPSDKALGESLLPDKAVELNKLSAGLMGQISPITLATLSQYMAVINSYYSNLIEGRKVRVLTEDLGFPLF